MVPEVLPARALDMRVLGLAMVTNAFGEPVSHEEVVQSLERDGEGRRAGSWWTCCRASTKEL